MLIPNYNVAGIILIYDFFIIYIIYNLSIFVHVNPETSSPNGHQLMAEQNPDIMQKISLD